MAKVRSRNTEFPSLTISQIIKELHKSCEAGPGNANMSVKGTQLLQIYALEIQLYTATKNNKKLKVYILFSYQYNEPFILQYYS